MTLNRLDRVAEDPQVTDDMRSQAMALSSLDEQLDYSIGSLAIVDASARAGDADIQRMAAYVGEVIVRHAPDAHWSRNRSDGEPVVAVGPWLTDPLEAVAMVVRRTEDATDGPSLAAYASGVIEYAHDPSEATANRLGWRLVGSPSTRVRRSK